MSGVSGKRGGVFLLKLVYQYKSKESEDMSYMIDKSHEFLSFLIILFSV